MAKRWGSATALLGFGLLNEPIVSPASCAVIAETACSDALCQHVRHQLISWADAPLLCRCSIVSYPRTSIGKAVRGGRLPFNFGCAMHRCQDGKLTGSHREHCAILIACRFGVDATRPAVADRQLHPAAGLLLQRL